MREVSRTPGEGGIRSLVSVVPAEREEYVIPLINAFVDRRAEVMTDVSLAYVKEDAVASLRQILETQGAELEVQAGR